MSSTSQKQGALGFSFLFSSLQDPPVDSHLNSRGETETADTSVHSFIRNWYVVSDPTEVDERFSIYFNEVPREVAWCFQPFFPQV